MSNIGVIGSGSWGTALTWLLSKNGHSVTLWSYEQSETAMFEQFHENRDKLPGVILPESVHYTCGLEEACRDRDMLVVAVPSMVLRGTAKKMKNFVEPGQLIVSVTKGIEESTLNTMSQILESEIPDANVAVLSGPSHAEEVGKGMPTAIVAGAHNKATALCVQKTFMAPFFRVYTSPDMQGIQLGAALKNVIALAAGMADGMGYGDKAEAALITRGSEEIARLGEKMGLRRRTLFGLSGIGDLIVTCSSVHSRNRKAGYLMGQGVPMEEAMKEVHQVVEGVYSARAGLKLAQKYGVEMPIIEVVNAVLFEGRSAQDGVEDLMLRKGRDEVEGWDADGDSCEA